MAKVNDEVAKQFSTLREAYQKQLTEIKKRIRVTSVSRVSAFLLTLLAIYISSGFGWIPLVLTGTLGFGIFIFLVIRHSKLFRVRSWLEQIIAINEKELRLLDMDTKGMETGQEFMIEEHPFASDLDIFGKRSLFQLLNRSATAAGKKRLAHSLNFPLKQKDLIGKRQQAIGELTAKLDWRQKFQATGMLATEDGDVLTELQNWASGSFYSFNRLLYHIALWLNPILGFGVILLIALNLVGFGVFLFFLFVPFALIGSKFNSINKEHALLGRKGKLLSRYAELFSLVSEENFEAELLADAQKELGLETDSARQAISELSRISAAFDYRLNLLVGIFLNIFFLWDIRQSIRLERWKTKYGNQLEHWFDTLARVDELSSIAGYAFAHPHSVFPEISDLEFELTAKDARHPFISWEQNVGNEISFTGWKQFQVITGANMAGKSTYLRTVGVNLVLAMTGSPVLAASLKFCPVDLFTSIKTSDSLQDGESYFFAELKRLKTIIDRLSAGDKLFIILDEILRGTNSQDKQKGSKALISQLIRLGASGMIATHDLSLGTLKDNFPGNLLNKRFEVEIEQDELVFDYKLKEGISQNLNASFLMEKMGIVLKS